MTASTTGFVACILLSGCLKQHRQQERDDSEQLKQQQPTASDNKPALPTATDRSPLSKLRSKIKFWEDRSRKHPQNWLFRVRLASRYQQLASLTHQSEPHAKALTHCAAAESVHPHRSLYVLQAKSYLALHKLPEAERALQKAGNVDPIRTVLSLRGRIQLLKGAYADARRSFEALRKSYKGKLEGEVMLAHLEETLGNNSAALTHYQSALTLAADKRVGQAWIHVLRGHNRMQSGQFEAARKDYRAALALSPTYVPAMEHLAEIEHKLGNHDRAVALYQGVLQLSRHPEFLSALGEVYAASGKPKEAMRVWNEAGRGFAAMLKKFPEAAYAHAADFYLGPGKSPQRAVKLLRANASLRPNADSYRRLAAALLALGEKRQAKSVLQKALAYPPRTAELHWTAHRVMAAIGDQSAAERHKRNALRLNPKQAMM